MKKRQPLVINNIRDMGESYYKPFQSVFGDCTENHKILERAPETVSLVVFCGGSDVSPNLYNESSCSLTCSDPARDEFEVSIFKKARLHEIPMLGICRGAQFLCAMAGGKLYQHVTGHNYGSHYLVSTEYGTIHVNSYHHQMMRPPQDAKIIAWCENRHSRSYLGGRDIPLEIPDVEPEVVYFPNIKALGIQYHPEIMNEKTFGYDFAGKVAEKYLK